MRNLRTPKIHNSCMYQHTHTSIYVHVNKCTSSTCADELRNNAVLVRHRSKRLRVTAGGTTQSLLGATRTDTCTGFAGVSKNWSYVQHLGNAAALRPQQGGRPRRARAMERRRRITSQYISCKLLRTRPCCM